MSSGVPPRAHAPGGLWGLLGRFRGVGLWGHLLHTFQKLQIFQKLKKQILQTLIETNQRLEKRVISPIVETKKWNFRKCRSVDGNDQNKSNSSNKPNKSLRNGQILQLVIAVSFRSWNSVYGNFP